MSLQLLSRSDCNLDGRVAHANADDVCIRPSTEKGVTRGRLYQFSERLFDHLLSGYRQSLTWVLKHPAPVVLVFLGTLALNVV